MKKIISILLSVFLITALFAGCGKTETSGSSAASAHDDKLKIVTTIFPTYDWVREIVGENSETADITLLLKNGVDLHSYQPSAEDMVAISNADVFVYVGGHSDSWVSDALQNAANPDRIVINLFDVLKDTLKPLVMTEGMEDRHEHHGHDDHEHDDHDHDHDHEHEHDEHEHDHDHDHEHEHEHDEHEHHHNDEHVWLSLPRAKAAVHAIAKQIAQADPAHASAYQSNTEAFEAELEALDQEYRNAAAGGKTNTLVFTDRFPFFYMADDYGLQYYAAFTGCSAESEASFETVALLAQKIDALGIANVITIENRSHKIPETVIENTKTKDQNILVMNSLQSVTSEQIQAGLTYLDAMKSNLDVLKTALQ